MNIQEFYLQKDKEIKQAELDFQAEQARLLSEIDKATKKRDALISKLQQERDEAAMKEKLKGYPAELVQEHKTCSICGAEMRPFAVVENEKVVKVWACQLGSLSTSHDLIRI